MEEKHEINTGAYRTTKLVTTSHHARKTKKTVGVLFAMLTVILIIGVNVSATVNYHVVKTIPIGEFEQSITTYINNPSYIKMKEQGDTYFNAHYNQSVKQHILDNISSYLLQKVLPAGYEPYCPLLAEICFATIALMLALFGHGMMGMGLASVAFWTVNLCGSLVTGSIVGALLLYEILFVGGFIAELMWYIIGGAIVYEYGLFGLLVGLICVMPVLFLLAVCAIPIAYIFGVLLVMEDNLNYCLQQPAP